MTHHQAEVHRSRRSTRQFLFNKTDSEFPNQTPDPMQVSECIVLPVESADAVAAQLRQEFPDIQAGKAFIDTAMQRLQAQKAFGAMAIRLDPPDPDPELEPEDAQMRLAIVARQLDALCKPIDAIWGQIGLNKLGCFVPAVTEAECLTTARKLQSALAALAQYSVSIGLAVYPRINFGKSQILNNACKALDHAAFFGPASTVAFDAVSLNISGDIFYQNGDISAAVTEFKTALLLDPTDVNVHNSLGVCYGVQGDFENALAEFQTAIWLDSNEAMAVFNAGLVNLLQGEKQNALDYFLEADRLKNDIYEVALEIGKLYLDLDNPEDGLEYLRRATVFNPDSSVAFRYLGQCCQQLDRRQEALHAFKAAVKSNPNDAAALSALGCLFDEVGENPEIAMMFCRQSVEIAPENGLYWHRLGVLCYKHELLDEAADAFQSAERLGHDSREFIEAIVNRQTAKAS